LTASLLAVVSLPSACGDGRIVCGAAPITDLRAAGVSEGTALDEPGLSGPPQSWTTRQRGQLAVLAPPANAGYTFVIDAPERDGTTCVTWNGAQFGHNSAAQDIGEVDVRPGHELSELVDVSGQGFRRFSLAGADQAAARIVQEPFRDGGGFPVPHERTTALEAVIAGHGRVYRVSMELPPGRSGTSEARQVLAALQLG
jgi:hypothetical protein